MVKKFKSFGPQLVFAEQTAGSVVVLTNEQKLSLYKKSQKSGISTDILEEVYRRGYSIWNESFGQTVEQFAFDRVNSFIAGGFAANLDEDLRNWFNPNHPEGGWKRINSKGEAIGPCAREPGEPKPKCMSNEKRAQLSKKERAAAVARKRKEDPNPERSGKPINVSNYGKKKMDEAVNAAQQAAIAIAMKKAGKKPKSMEEEFQQLEEKNVPTSPEKWAKAKALAKSKFSVYPSAYANGFAAKKYKEMGGGWKSVSEETVDEACWTGYKKVGMKKKGDRMVPNCVPVNEDEQDDISAANAAVSKKIRAGRDINLPSPEEIEKRNEIAKGAGDIALSFNPITGLAKTAYDTYGDAKQGNYKDAAVTAALGTIGALAGPIYKGGKSIIGSIAKKVVKEDNVNETIRKVILEKQQGLKLHSGKHFKNNETVELQSKDPNDPDSRFDGTKSAKNVYQKITPGQPVTEATGDEAKAALNDRSKVLDQIVSQSQQAQNPQVKTSASQVSDRRQFNTTGEVKTIQDPSQASNVGSQYVVPNAAAKPKMTNALTTIKRVVKESAICEDCNCGLREEVLNERGADSKGYYRSTESGAGLTAKGAKHFGIHTAVTTPPSKLKAGSKAANRRKSFCARMGGMKGPMKDEKGRPTRKAMSLRRWHC